MLECSGHSFCGDLVRPEALHRPAAEADRSRIRGQDTRDKVEKCSFPCAVGSYEGLDRSFPYAETDHVYRLQTSEPSAYVHDLEEFHYTSSSSVLPDTSPL